MIKYYLFSAASYLLGANLVLAQSNIQIPTGRPITLPGLLDLGQNFGGFLMIAGSILAGITLISSGIMYLMAGSNPGRVTTAKGIFKAGIIGSLIIFGAGMIVNTVGDFAQNPFGFFED